MKRFILIPFLLMSAFLFASGKSYNVDEYVEYFLDHGSYIKIEGTNSYNVAYVIHIPKHNVKRITTDYAGDDFRVYYGDSYDDYYGFDFGPSEYKISSDESGNIIINPYDGKPKSDGNINSEVDTGIYTRKR